jgi:tripartite-type tricarboxylate transporter receptor subunit TctC
MKTNRSISVFVVSVVLFAGWMISLSGFWGTIGFGVQAANAQTSFYKGKLVRIIVGYSPGGFYDRWARLLSRYMSKHVPGNPNFIVENRPGAGSLVAANHVYNVAERDGLTLLMPSNGLYLEQLLGRKEVQFDVSKFNWIGTQEKNHIVLYIRADSPIKSVRDILLAKDPPKCGSTGTSGDDYRLARLLEATLGLNIKTITGYGGGAEVDLAVERGEVICRGVTIPPHFGREPFITWHKKGFDRHLLQTGSKRDRRLPEAPTFQEVMNEFGTPESKRQVARIILAGGELGRPMAAPPGTPQERVNLLRQAYAKSLKDSDLLAEAEKGKMDVELTEGEELQNFINELVAQPPDVIEQVKKVLLQ